MSHPIASCPRSLLLTISLVLCLLHGRPALAADLSDAEKETARQVESLLKQAETNLKLAQDSAGAGNAPLTGAKAKLVATRMQPAVDALPAIAERLKKLPADLEQVAALQKRSDAAAAAIAALQARLGAKPATPEPGAVKLDFRQEESLKNARFILNEIEGQRAALEKIAEQVKPVEDITKIDHRVMQKAANSIAFAKQRSGFMTDHMSKLPANGAGVAAVADGGRLDTSDDDGVTFRAATLDECQSLECLAVWEPEHIEDRIRDHYAGVPNKWVESLRPRAE